jgi:flagellar motor switch protein FliN/FliY
MSTIEQDSPTAEEGRSSHAELLSRTTTDVNLDTLLKVPVSLSIEVGRTKMSINEIMNMREGSVIELERLLDEPLDILVNGALIAHGVVVLANDRFGIQITDIISPQDRIRTI